MGAKKNPNHSQLRLRQLLREMRIGARLNQSELADRLGVDQSFVSRFERGQRRLDLIELAKICASCGTNLGELVSKFEVDESYTFHSPSQSVVSMTAAEQ